MRNRRTPALLSEFRRRISPLGLLAYLVLLLAIRASASTPYLYYAQNAQGNGTGQSCINAFGIASFSLAAWGPGAGQIGPASTLHLCGQITAPAGASGFLQFRGSGTAGNPVTLVFEPGAVLQSPWWGLGGAIGASGVNYIVVDGGTNGIIRATANGSSRQYQKDGMALYFESVSNSEVKNLTIADIYVRTSLSDVHAGDAYGMRWTRGSGLSFHNNTIHDTQAAFLYAFCGDRDSNVYSNAVFNVNWGLILGDAGAGCTLGGANTWHDNDIHDFGMWDEPAGNGFHHDGIYGFTNFAGSALNGLVIDRNHIYGVPGTYTNAFIFVSNSGGVVQGARITNNLLENAGPGYPANGPIHDWGTDTVVQGNTLRGASSASSPIVGNQAISCNPCTRGQYTSNTLDKFYIGTYIAPGGSVAQSDYNTLTNLSVVGVAVGYYYTLPDWQSCKVNGCPPNGPDAHSSTSVQQPPPVTTITVTPATVSLGQSGTQLFAATVVNGSNPVWTLTGAGSISASGLYTAPASILSAQAVTVKATSGTASASATVNLVPPVVQPPPSVTSCPAGTLTIRGSSTPVFYLPPC